MYLSLYQQHVIDTGNLDIRPFLARYPADQYESIAAEIAPFLEALADHVTHPNAMADVEIRQFGALVRAGLVR